MNRLAEPSSLRGRNPSPFGLNPVFLRVGTLRAKVALSHNSLLSHCTRERNGLYNNLSYYAELSAQTIQMRIRIYRQRSSGLRGIRTAKLSDSASGLESAAGSYNNGSLRQSAIAQRYFSPSCVFNGC